MAIVENKYSWKQTHQVDRWWTEWILGQISWIERLEHYQPQRCGFKHKTTQGYSSFEAADENQGMTVEWLKGAEGDLLYNNRCCEYSINNLEGTNLAELGPTCGGRQGSYGAMVLGTGLSLCKTASDQNQT